MRFHHIAHLVLAAATLTVAEPIAPKTDPIRLPALPVPAPQPVPKPVTSLASDQLYVIDADVPCIVLASPAGIVSVSEDSGPVKIRGKFVDGDGKMESRQYKGKSVFSIEATGNGRVELIIVPQSGSGADVIRRTLDVGSVQPPPNPQPGPSPEPDVKPVQLWGFVIVEETSAAVAGRGSLLADPTLSAFLKAKNYHWRVVDKDVQGPDGKPPADVLAALNASTGKQYPQFFAVDSKGHLLAQQILPDASGIVAVLKKLGGN